MLAFITTLVLTACGGNEEAVPIDNGNTGTESNENTNEEGSNSHSGSGEVSEGLAEAENPTYPVGTQVTINADHMEGMDGATVTIDTAEQTTVYMVDYTDAETGEKITNHMWVTESELSPVE